MERFLPAAIAALALLGPWAREAVCAEQEAGTFTVRAISPTPHGSLPLDWRDRDRIDSDRRWPPLPPPFFPSADSISYNNLTRRLPGFIFGPTDPGGGIFAEDLHMVVPGRLTLFRVLLNRMGSAPCEARFFFYENDENDAQMGRLLAGPYVQRLLRGDNLYGVFPPDSARVGRHVWFAVQFTCGTAGVFLASQAEVGQSHDLYWDFSAGRAASLQDPPANFCIEVRVLPDPVVAVLPTTWSRLKAMYAGPAPPLPMRLPAPH